MTTLNSWSRTKLTNIVKAQSFTSVLNLLVEMLIFSFTFISFNSFISRKKLDLDVTARRRVDTVPVVHQFL